MNKIIKLAILNHSYYLLVAIFTTVLPVLLMQNGMDEAQIGWLYSFRRLSGFLYLLILPTIAGRFGAKNVAIFTIIVYTISLTNTLIASDFYQLLLLMFLTGFAMSTYSSFIASFQHMTLENKNRARITSLINILVLLSFSLVPFAVKYVKYSKIIWFCIIIFLAFINYYLISSLELKVQNTKVVNLMQIIRENCEALFSNFAFEFVSNSLFVFTVIYLVKSGIAPEDASTLIGCYSMAGLLSCYLVGIILDSSNKKLQVIEIATISTLLLTIPIEIFNTKLSFLTIVYALLGISTNFLAIGIPMLLNNKYKNDELITVNTSISLTAVAAKIIATPLVGLALKYQNSLVLPYLVLLIFYIIFIGWQKSPVKS